jgi:hypothetical protein
VVTRRAHRGGSLALFLGSRQFSSASRRWARHPPLDRTAIPGRRGDRHGGRDLHGVIEPHRACGWFSGGDSVCLDEPLFGGVSRNSPAAGGGAPREWMIHRYVVTYGFFVFRARLSFRLIAALGPEAITLDALVVLGDAAVVC